MNNINPKVFYELWLEENKKKDPNFRDTDPIATQSEIIEMLQEDNTVNKEINNIELENHMVIGEYYSNEDEDNE